MGEAWLPMDLTHAGRERQAARQPKSGSLDGLRRQLSLTLGEWGRYNLC